MKTQIPLSELKTSEANVRRRSTEIATLVSSIRSVGLLSPLIVAIADSGYEVVAGNRRLLALQELTKEGHDPDRPISVHVLADGENLIEASLAENIIRQGMTAPDEVRAYSTLVDSGCTIDEIAHKFGTARRHVEQRLALANLAPRVFEAFEDGILTLEGAKGFTFNPDHGEQTRVFDQLTKDRHNGDYYLNKPDYVRRMLVDDTVRATASIAKFVGIDAFREAGGTVHTDLFDEEEGSYLTPSQLLTDLADAKILIEAETIRIKQKLVFVRPFLQHYTPYNETGLYRWRGDGRPKKADLGEAQVGRILLLDSDGTTRVDQGYYTDREIKKGGAIGSKPVVEDSKAADAVSAKATKILAEQRRDVLRINLTRDHARSQAVMIFCLVDRAIHSGSGYYDSPTGSNLSTSPGSYDTSSVQVGDHAGLEAAEGYAEWYAGLDKSWLRAGSANQTIHGSKGGQAAERCAAFLELEQDEQAKWATFALCHSLRATSSGDGNGSRFHDYLGQLLSIDVRKDYTPTVASYFGFLSKGQILAILEPVDSEVAAAAKKQKTGEVKELAADMAKEGGKLADFVPRQLAFNDPELDMAEREEPVEQQEKISGAESLEGADEAEQAEAA